MREINILDKKFSLFISEKKIQNAVSKIASQINVDLANQTPIFLSVLNGAFMFSADLLKRIDIPCEIVFIRVASYQGLNSTGEVKQIIGLTKNITGRIVVILEDVIDSGATIEYLYALLKEKQPKEIKVASMFVKPDNVQIDNICLDYVGMNIPNDFIVGYGLDYNEQGRNLSQVYKIVE
jgi:hypoxanthine phosphoribosyltransferase